MSSPSRSSSTSSFSLLPPAPVLRAQAMRALGSIRLDLGVRSLLPEWRAMVSPVGLREDVIAGLTVASVALPLSLAIALASDVQPGVGLVTAIVAGIVCALFGGQTLAVSGPAAAMAVLVGQVVDVHGLAGLLVVGLGCGVLQIASGMIGAGRFVRLVPLSVVHGFTAGIGVLILVGQLPRALGLPSPDESHVMDVVAHLWEYLAHANLGAVAISISVVAAMIGLPRISPKIPAALIAVAVPSALVALLGVDVPMLGAIPQSLPMPSLPALPSSGLWALFGDALVVYALASLESLLSTSAVDKLRGPSTPPHDSDQELIGQGLGNVATALFGGIPVTSVIARSALNVHAGARTRRSAILHALVLIGCVYFAGDIVARLPIAALAGVLLATGIRMLDARYLRELWHAARTEAIVFIITVVMMVSFDLLAGVQAGLVAALIVALLRLGRVRGELHPAHDGSPHQLALSGPLTFLSTARLDELRAELGGLDVRYGLVIDVRHVDFADASGAQGVLDMVTAWRERGGKAALLGLNAELERRFIAIGGDDLRGLIAHFEADLDRLLDRERSRVATNAHQRLVRGVDRFRSQVRGKMAPLIDRLAAGQHPHTLFLTCADSRVPPKLMTGSHPGELFVVRNIGALLPPSGHNELNDEGAAIEYGVRVLGVRNIVICGHSKCGAMTALRDGLSLTDLPALSRWAQGATEIAGELAAAPSLEEATQRCSVRQLDHLRSYPVVREALARGELRIAAWYYDVETAEVLEHDPDADRYVPVGSKDDTGAVQVPAAAPVPAELSNIH